MEPIVTEPSVAAAFAVALFLAVFGERISQVVFVPILDLVVKPRAPEALRIWVYRLVGAIPGGFMAWLLQVDVFSEMGVAFPSPWGVLISCMNIGFGANFVHETVAALRTSRGAVGEP